MVVEEDSKQKEEGFYKRSLKLQKEGLVSLLRIIKKSTKQRDRDDKEHLIHHLKFRVPFFKNMNKELISTLVEKLECQIF